MINVIMLYKASGKILINGKKINHLISY